MDRDMNPTVVVRSTVFRVSRDNAITNPALTSSRELRLNAVGTMTYVVSDVVSDAGFPSPTLDLAMACYSGATCRSHLALISRPTLLLLVPTSEDEVI